MPKKGLSVDIKHNFKPTYEIPPDKVKVVNDLRKAVANAKDVYLASDEDREGEAIAWHLCQALSLKPENTKRIVFHEITDTAIKNAIKHPRTVDINLVNSQQARRILDRIVGYELSPVLWKKVRAGLSAGRVQSVAVRLIVEREREIKDFKPVVIYKILGIFKGKHEDIPAELDQKFKNAELARKFLEDCIKATYTISAIDKKPSKRNPSAPFTTSTLQQEAARLLGFSVKQTMTLAQRLYENGYITYMRTDSTNLSNQALANAERYISDKYGAKYSDRKVYRTKQLNAEEAHEAIRPTNFNVESAGEDDKEAKLYKLIWRRALASQMSAAEIEKTEAIINISTRKETFIAKGEIVTFDGFLKVYGGAKEDVILPDLKVSDNLININISAKQTYSKPPARYSEAALVRKLEELGIGRPSTYVPTISTIQSRGYIEKTDIEGQSRELLTIVLSAGKISEVKETDNFSSDKNKLIPTPIADVTTDFLTKYFKSIVDYDFTARAEDTLDDIADGKYNWVEMLSDFYEGFHPLIVKSEDISRKESMQARKIGVDEASGKPIYARYGRYGPMLQKGEATDEEKPIFASLPPNTSLEEVTLDEALEMFKLPRVLGTSDDGKPIEANIGRFGPYIKVGSAFISIKDKDPLKISIEEAKEIYEEKKKAIAEKNIKEFKGGIKVLNGPYGPYIKSGKKNAKIPDNLDPKTLTEAQAKEILATPPQRNVSRGRKSKVKVNKSLKSL